MRFNNHLDEIQIFHNTSQHTCIRKTRVCTHTQNFNSPKFALWLTPVHTYRQYFKNVSATLPLHCLKYSNGCSFLRIKCSHTLAYRKKPGPHPPTLLLLQPPLPASLRPQLCRTWHWPSCLRTSALAWLWSDTSLCLECCFFWSQRGWSVLVLQIWLSRNDRQSLGKTSHFILSTESIPLLVYLIVVTLPHQGIWVPCLSSFYGSHNSASHVLDTYLVHSFIHSKL